MSDFRLFLKDNQKTRENTQYAATTSLADDDGQPVEWTIRPIDTAEHEEIRDAAFETVPVNVKKGMYRKEFHTKKYKADLITHAVVFPPLHNAELQDSYGVKKPEDLIQKLIPNSAEYDALFEFITKHSGIEPIDIKVKKAKNS